MMSCDDTKLAKMNGLLQTSTGLGMLTGPLLGSILYLMGGYQLPFYSVGTLLLMLAIFLKLSKTDFFRKPNSVQNIQNNFLSLDETSRQESVAFSPSSVRAFSPKVNRAVKRRINDEEFGFSRVMLSCCLCMSISMMCLTFKEPIMAVRLAENNVSMTMVAILLSIDTVAYTICSFILGILP